MEAAVRHTVIDALRALDDDELLDLELALADEEEEVLEAGSDGGFLSLGKGIEKARLEYYRRLEGLTGRLQDGRITQARFEREAGELIAGNFEKVYKDHRGLAELTAGDKEYLNRAVAEEMKYAIQFGQDIVDESLLMPREQRAGMYAKTLDGIGLHALVEAEPDDARFYWVLGVAEHCVDCLILADQSPYDKWNLPTTPRAGATKCLSHCKCRIRVVRGRRTKREREAAEAYGYQKDLALSEMLAPPTPPKGLRAPTVVEAKYIDNLRSKINTQRRIIEAEEDPKRLKAAVAKRKAYNDELIDFLEKEGVYEVPVWSVDDVLDERHVGKRAVRDIFRHGLDGKSLSLVEKRKLAALLARYERLTGRLLSDESIVKALD